MIIRISFYELDLIPAKQIRVKEDGIMGVKYQLGMLNIDLIIVEQIQNVHECNGVDRSIKLIHN